LDLPGLTDEETAFAADMQGWLAALIDQSGGALPFDRYMEAVLYAPGRGYYVNGRRKFGEGGDFVTAPEVSPLFARCLAAQVAECLQQLGGGDVIEFGAGSGRMAADMLLELERLDRLPDCYRIMEVSPSLRSLQRETLEHDVPHLVGRVAWLEQLPATPVRAVVVGNELLDAMPVHRFRRHARAWQELHVGILDGRPVDNWQPMTSTALADVLERIFPNAEAAPDGYSSEVNLRLHPWIAALSQSLDAGYLLLIDYGYPRHEYYHAERSSGTLICHFRHRAHADPYLLPGLQDLTANVDFTAVAEAGSALGFELCGYASQAHFLIANGLERWLADSDPNDARAHLKLMQGVKKLTLPSEMGERFKVIGLAYHCEPRLQGFSLRDLRDRL